jgi:glycogen debranching enzyme
MDAKVNDFVVTPRNGKAVEINSLWYNAIKTLLELAKYYKDAKIVSKLKLIPTKLRKQFIKSFYNDKGKYLNDLVGNSKIRPNQLFALSLTYPVIDPTSDIANEIIDTVDKKLLMTHGLKTLARGDEDFTAEYEGGLLQRDMAYHQGPTWPWLSGLYFDALNNMAKAEKSKSKKKKLEEKLKRFVDDTYLTYKKEIYDSEGVCTISELYNSKLPYKAGGTISQAWSVAEVLRIIKEHN